MLLTKEQILNAQDTKTQTIEVPEWGGSVIVSTMSGAAKDRFEASVMQNGSVNTDNIRAKLIASCVIDDKGNLLFSERDVVSLGRKSAVALDRIFSAIQTLNHITNDDVEKLAKN